MTVPEFVIKFGCSGYDSITVEFTDGMRCHRDELASHLIHAVDAFFGGAVNEITARNAALEEAATVCDGMAQGKTLTWSADNAAAIRALKAGGV